MKMEVKNMVFYCFRVRKWKIKDCYSCPKHVFICTSYGVGFLFRESEKSIKKKIALTFYVLKRLSCVNITDLRDRVNHADKHHF